MMDVPLRILAMKGKIWMCRAVYTRPTHPISFLAPAISKKPEV